ncbi:SUOX [Symbiodinium sp. KB8]|nr:SUOX [Symbiodinium sp. KB8]
MAMASRLGQGLGLARGARCARWASASSQGQSRQGQGRQGRQQGRQGRQGWQHAAHLAARHAGAAVPAVLACQYLDRHFLSCEEGSQGSSGGSSIIRFRVDVDRPGLLSEATEVLKKQQVNIRDARISTEEGSKRATHIYFVEESGERKGRRGGLSEERLAEVRAALTQLASGSCEAEPWPIFSSEEVSKHQTPSTGIWVSYKDGVYDITDFVQNHPGGKDKIMLAAGKAIDPFWRIYQQHTGRGNALELLESMRIGDLSDPPDTTRTASDPYDSDPERHPGLIFHNNKPCNAELPSELMMDSWLTPNPVWFIRHHHPVPEVNPEDYRLCIEGVGTKAVTLCLEDLKKRFLKREVVATLQCGGNRRSELDQIQKTSGIPWGFGAMSTARWGGVYLREVLQHCAGLSHENVEAFDVKHVIFKGMDGMEASIPIEKALSPYGDVLLAYEMNGEALPNEHGAPVRVIVPGVVGVRNVKWVGRVVASTEEAEGPWQRGLAYKGFSPMVKELQGIDVEKIPSMHELPVQSAIVSPKPGSVTELDDLEVKGFAWSGGGRGIVRVDVSIDEGKTWITAELSDGKDQCYNRAWAWTFWEASVPVPAELQGKEFTVLCRAVDSAYSTQPERPEPLWNLRGLNCNCWHRVPIRHEE